MSVQEAAVRTAAQVSVGAVAGIWSGLRNAAAPHFSMMRSGAMNASSKFFNATTKSLQAHHKVGTAVAAGTAAVLGHGALATAATAAGMAVVAAAPVVLGAAAVCGAAYGGVRLAEHLRDNA